MDFSIPQQKAIDIRDTNVVVSASAGSGKTAVLVERLCQLVLKDHISIDSILAMTFTKDAAAEMKARLLSKLKEQPKTEIDRQVDYGRKEKRLFCPIKGRFDKDKKQHCFRN